MTRAQAIAIAEQLLADCKASPEHDMPRPSPDERQAIAILLADARLFSRFNATTPVECPDMSGCA